MDDWRERVQCGQRRTDAHADPGARADGDAARHGVAAHGCAADPDADGYPGAGDADAVRDGHRPGDRDAHAETTLRVLREVGAGERPVLTVLNKRDLIPDPLGLAEALARHPGSIAVSAVTGEGIPELLAELDRLAAKGDRRLRLLIPHDRYELVGRLHAAAGVVSEEATDDGVRLVALVPDRLRAAVEPFVEGEA